MGSESWPVSRNGEGAIAARYPGGSSCCSTSELRLDGDSGAKEAAFFGEVARKLGEGVEGDDEEEAAGAGLGALGRGAMAGAAAGCGDPNRVSMIAGSLVQNKTPSKMPS